MSLLRLASLSFVVACGGTQKHDDTSVRPTPVKPAADANAPPITEIELKTKNGLSGLAVDEQGRLWTMPERALEAYRITLDSRLAPHIETFKITNLPIAHDLESIEMLAPDRLAFGTEGRGDNSATIQIGELHGDTITITSTITFTSEQIGLTLSNNHGAEGLCGHGGTLIVGIEEVGTEDGKRWAPLLRVFDGKMVRRHRLFLTSETGKLSALDCVVKEDGTIRVWGIERHFEVARVLVFDLPAPGEGSDDIMPTLAVDLEKTLRPGTNLEGIAHMADGRIVLVNDNQYSTISGPNMLFILKSSLVK